MKKIRIKAFAKINLSLDVIAKREDGYHEVEMVLQSISLHDELLFMPSRVLSLETKEQRLPTDDRNLIIKTAKKLIEFSGFQDGARIILKKKIPVGAGLGGGSADAAATLVGLNRLWGLNLPLSTLERLGVSVGADVPFCLTGGTALAKGIGEILNTLPTPPSERIFLTKPPFSVSTALVYKKLSLEQEDWHPEIKSIISIIQRGELLPITHFWGNMLEKVTLKLYPEIKEVMEWLGASGFSVRMTGSGPTLFMFIPETCGCFNEVKTRLRKIGWWTYEGSLVGKGLELREEKGSKGGVENGKNTIGSDQT